MLRLSSAVVAVVAVVVLGVPSDVSASRPIVDPGASCTVIYAADGEVALGGNNEDGFNPLTKIWFVPGVDGGYGSAWVGYDDLVIQGGMNEAGLFFDALAVREVTVPPDPNRPEVSGPVWPRLMSRCATVDCVREFYDQTSLPGTWNGQALFGDSRGDSVIVEPLAVLPKDGTFQVATNFFQWEVPSTNRTDERYDTATSMLGRSDRFSPDVIRDVLQATHQEGDVNTVYSTVYDLKARTIDLYYFHDYSTNVTFDLATELAKGVHGYDIAALFGPNVAADALAAPIHRRIAATLATLPSTTVTHDALAPLAGTYEAAASARIEVMASGDILSARQPWSPWVPLHAVSDREFVNVFSDPAGAVMRLDMRFTDVGAEPAAVEITDGSGNGIVAMRTTPSPPTGIGPFLIGLGAIAVALIAAYASFAQRRPRSRRTTATAPGR
jgi:hypothetical protein